MSKKRKFDLIIPLGPACSCSQILRAAGLQHLSFPYDWVGPDPASPSYADDIVRRVTHICNGFAGWIDKDDFRPRTPYGAPRANGMIDYVNVRHDLLYLHDFPHKVPFEQAFPAIREKYLRRIDRFLTLLKGSRRVLIARVERPNLDFRTPVETFKRAREILARKYPDKTFDFIAFSPHPGLPCEERIVEHPEDWLTTVTYDYRSCEPGAEPHQPDLEEAAAVMRTMAKVRDYRTREEIRRHKEALLRKKLAEAGCDTLLQLRWKKLKNSIRKRISWASFKFE